MDKIEVSQRAREWATKYYGYDNEKGLTEWSTPSCHMPVENLAKMLARFERDLSRTPQSVEPVATAVAALVEAAKRCIQIVERHNQRQNEKVGDVKLILRSALTPFKGQDDA